MVGHEAKQLLQSGHLAALSSRGVGEMGGIGAASRCPRPPYQQAGGGGGGEEIGDATRQIFEP